jgi:hypothetical protein
MQPYREENMIFFLYIDGCERAERRLSNTMKRGKEKFFMSARENLFCYYTHCRADKGWEITKVMLT